MAGKIMKIIIQRVKGASVRVDGKEVGALKKHGLLIFFAAGKGDSLRNNDFLTEKAAGLRIFEDEKGKMNLSVKDVHGGILVVPEFTLYGDCSRGKRPGFDKSAPPEEARPLFNDFVSKMRIHCPDTETGQFQAHMEVSSINDGPVTFIIEK